MARHHKRVSTYIFLILSLILTIIISGAMGQYTISLRDVIAGIFSPLGLMEAPHDPTVMSVLWSIRFPRIALGIMVGAALAVAGTVMQSVFSNPLAEPGIIGVSSGASVGASLAIVFAPQALAGFGVPLSAFVSGTAAAFLVYGASRSRGKAEVISLVLTGIAVTAVCGAITSFATYLAPTTSRDQIVFWQMGSLAGASWAHAGTVAAVTILGVIGAIAIAKQLDTLALGEKAAGHVGINVNGLRICSIALSALLSAAAVSYAGVIGFVGLIVPHLLRLVIGPSNRYLIPASMLGGALLISLSDLVARTILPFADLPIGIFTALVGGPTFFILLRRGMHLAKKG
ncbi:ABC transporter permease [Boudabousia marimammalium]|uniref:ABC transporter permease n=2 Tax=Boudabousia marimammalium TaxID=156892 RepID=A0A1Q5PSV8_9ACTO|nr:ABC transporter permease [Boudabousia marimammalium]